MDKTELFEKSGPVKALAVMAAPTIASQLIVLFILCNKEEIDVTGTVLK